MADGSERLLLVDDDAVFGAMLSHALAARGFDVFVSQDAETGLELARAKQPRRAVVDLKLGSGSGLLLIPRLLDVVPGIKILLLAGYASIATAVEAVKRGAHDYLTKPVDADAHVQDGAAPLKRLEWEHIQRVLAEAGGDVSQAARRLGLHRRPLQRKRMKRPVRERC